MIQSLARFQTFWLALPHISVAMMLGDYNYIRYVADAARTYEIKVQKDMANRNSIKPFFLV